MANILMTPNLSQLVPGAGVERKAQLPVNDDASFAQHLERKLQTEQREKKNLLGTEPTKAKASKSERSERSAENEETPATIEALLQQVMTKLKEMAEKPGDGAEAGQWTFQLQDIGLLEKLAAQAGMDAASLAALKKQMEEQGGLPLADLFDALAENFQELAADTKVTVDETYLPLLETLLSKLGVTPEAIKALDSKGVNGVDQLDLIAYLQGLKEVSANVEGQTSGQTCVLSDWELEQLSAMLAEAGVPSAKIEMLFPEKMPLWQKALDGLRPEQGDSPVEISLDRLKDILQQAVNAVDQARPKADLPGFLTELETILNQAGFKSSDVGWSPVVQGSVKSAYDELQKMIDQAKVQDERIAIKVQNETFDEEWQLSDTKVIEVSTPEQESDGLSGDGGAGLKEGLMLVGENLSEEAAAVGGVEMKAASQVPAEPSIRVQPPRLHLTPEMQQLTVEQISQGVLRGLRNHEHHLTLTLYPKELGEVKVDLQMRGSQMSANFVMENQKVKEAMESNMEEFKDNLERRGFTLESMSVSVGGQNHSNDSGQRFVEAWEQIKAKQNREVSAVPGVSPLEFVHNEQSTLRQGGISLFV